MVNFKKLRAQERLTKTYKRRILAEYELGRMTKVTKERERTSIYEANCGPRKSFIVKDKDSGH